MKSGIIMKIFLSKLRFLIIIRLLKFGVDAIEINSEMNDEVIKSLLILIV
jgi:hypothetical protein